jgi:hypothetical protein
VGEHEQRRVRGRKLEMIQPVGRMEELLHLAGLEIDGDHRHRNARGQAPRHHVDLVRIVVPGRAGSARAGTRWPGGRQPRRQFRAAVALADRSGHQRLIGVDGGDTAMRRQLGQQPRLPGGGVQGVDGSVLRVKDRAGLPADWMTREVAPLVDMLDLPGRQRHQVDAVRGGHEQLGAVRGVTILGEIEAGAARLGRKLHDPVAGVGIDPRAGKLVGRPRAHGEAGKG